MQHSECETEGGVEAKIQQEETKSKKKKGKKTIKYE